MATTPRPFAFVLMPFSKNFDDIYKLGIKAACENAGVLAERVDEQKFSETILERIYRQIRAADFIIADMSDRNPNVFYEVGYAHSQGKICTLIAQRADEIPFDLKHHRHIIYEGSISKLRGALDAELDWLKSEAEKARAKTLVLEVKSASGLLEKSDWQIQGSLDLAVDLHNDSGKRSPEIEAIYIYTNNNWNFTQDGVECPVADSSGGPKKYRTFVKPPVSRLSSGGGRNFAVGENGNYGVNGGEMRPSRNTHTVAPYISRFTLQKVC